MTAASTRENQNERERDSSDTGSKSNTAPPERKPADKAAAQPEEYGRRIKSKTEKKTQKKETA